MSGIKIMIKLKIKMKAVKIYYKIKLGDKFKAKIKTNQNLINNTLLVQEQHIVKQKVNIFKQQVQDIQLGH